MEQRIAAAVTLLGQKQALFSQYYEATAAIVEDPDFDVLEQYITMRDNLANEIDILDEKIYVLLEPWAEELPGLLGARTERAALQVELQPLWEPCATLQETMRRTRLKNNEALVRVHQLRDEAAQQLKNNQNMPKISKYLNNLTESHGGNNFGKI